MDGEKGVSEVFKGTDLEDVDPRIWYVTDDQWDQIQEILGQDPGDSPKLRRLFSHPEVFTRGDE